VRIAILGAGGFIGSHLVEHLLSHGRHVVVGLDTTDEKLAGISGENFTFHQADVRNVPELLDEMVREADMVVDLIAHANPSMYVTTPIEVFELNFIQNLRIAEVCMKHRKRLIQYSSAEVYGKANDGEFYSEEITDLVLGPVSKQRWIYATAKILLERVLYGYGASGELEYTIVRPFNFIGPRLDYLVPAGSMGGPRVFPHWMSALLTGGPIYLVDGGHVHRAFMHIADANAGFQTLLDRPAEGRNEIFNMGNPNNNLTIRDLAYLMIDVYEELTGEKVQSPIVEVSGEEFYGEGYEDSNRLPPDISKLQALGWQPKRDVRTTFRDAVSYYVEHPEESVAITAPNSVTGMADGRLVAEGGMV
jgi:UDP-apiose/xylose synthase